MKDATMRRLHRYYLSLFSYLFMTASIRVQGHSVLELDARFGAIPNDQSPSVMRHNTQVLSDALQTYVSNNTLLIDKTFYLYHGVFCSGLHDTIIEINGALRFQRDFRESGNENLDPSGSRPMPCLLLEDSTNVTLTSSNKERGLIHGGGPQWWGIPFLGYLELVEHRPVLFQVNTTKNMLIENLVLQDAPLYTMKFQRVNGLEISHLSIVNRRTNHDGHSLVDLSAFNTDGIDVAGHNVYVHDVDVWNQDDCIAVKDGDLTSSNMTFERIYASGVGLTIGSIGGTTVQNIAFRHVYLHKTFKGIYMKFRKPDPIDNRTGLIENALFENITMEQPQQWGVWIGPAQQADSRNPCAPHPCSLCWPSVPFAQCEAVPESQYVNITLKDVTMNNPLRSPGVILGDGTHGIDGIVFDNVVVTRGPPLLEGLVGRDRVRAFPGLYMPVNDNNLHRGYALFVFLVLIVFASIGFCIGRCVYRRFKMDTRHEPLSQEDHDETDMAHSASQRENDTRRTDWQVQGMIVVALLVSSLFAMLALREASVSKSVGDLNNYFECRGVSGGVARGNTWPIPSCFADETTNPQGHWTRYRLRPNFFFVVTAVAMMIVSCATLVLLMRRVCRTSPTNQIRTTTDETLDQAGNDTDDWRFNPCSESDELDQIID